MISTLIVDDEPLARQRLCRLLGAHSDVSLVGEAETGGEAVAACLELRPDLILLDVNMPDCDGLEALSEISQKLPEGLRPLVIFVTAHEEHALSAFDLEALDFMVKPVSALRLERALKRVRLRLHERSGSQRGMGETQRTPDEPPERGYPVRHLVAAEGSRLKRVPLAEIAVIEVRDSLVFARTESGEYRLSETLAELESHLPSPPFVRVSRSALIHLDWIAHLEPGFRGAWVVRLRAPLEGEVSVARRRVTALRAML